MKSKTIIIGLGLVVLGGVIFYVQRSSSGEVQSAPASSGIPVAKPTLQPTLSPVSDATPLVATKPLQVAVLTEAEVQAKIYQLKMLQAEDDDASLAAILAELKNPNPQIRHEAIEATCQFQSRSAIPVLEALAAETADPAEKKELLDAAEFLKLPTYTEYLAEQKKAKEAAKAAVPAQ